MANLRTNDNNTRYEKGKQENLRGENLSLITGFSEAEDLNNLYKIANKTVKQLIDNEDFILIFPHSLNKYNDDIDKSKIFSLKENANEKILTTYNLMGFVGRNETQLTISSRFYPNGNDFFLHYMLHKVFAINIFSFDQTKDKPNIWDFLVYLFPYYLKQALNQGLFKEYQGREYNDANVKGPIDVARHIHINNPFMGKIAYRTREHSYDNRLTQLIRHTIEYIRIHKFSSGILMNDPDTRSAVSQIIYATPSYDRNGRLDIINQNLKPHNHPYFTEYAALKKICLQILRQEGLAFGVEKNKIYGLLFDGAWLWEEYLNTILKNENFIHPKNKGKFGDKNPIYLFEKDNYERFPDFYCNKKEIVLDAKYKRLKNSNEINRDDMHQIITYMYVLKSKFGGFILPDSETKKIIIGTLNGYGNTIHQYALNVTPECKNDFTEYWKDMEKEGNKFAKMLAKE